MLITPDKYEYVRSAVFDMEVKCVTAFFCKLMNPSYADFLKQNNDSLLYWETISSLYLLCFSIINKLINIFEFCWHCHSSNEPM